MRFQVLLPRDVDAGPFYVSPDGRRLVFAAVGTTTTNATGLWMRTLSQGMHAALKRVKDARSLPSVESVRRSNRRRIRMRPGSRCCDDLVVGAKGLEPLTSCV